MSTRPTLPRARPPRRWRLPLALALGLGVGLGVGLTPPARAADKSGVTPNTVSLPKGPGSIEGLGEAFEPLLSDGTGKYAVALRLPPGTAGHTPSLLLRYGGGNGNGPLGSGWRLDVPAIQRRTAKGIPRYVDGPNGVDDDHDGETDEADETDVFVDSDAEELVPVANADGLHTDYFRRHERTFVRYRRLGDAWEGRLPDGTRLEFGVTPAGRLTDGSGTRVFRWLLERSTDTSGNTILFLYRSLPEAQNTNQVYLAEIRYGPGAPTAALTWPAFHFAHFSYEARPDWFEDCRAGFAVRTGMRLTRIAIGTQGVDLSGQGHAAGDHNGDGEHDVLNRAYILGYGADPHWSLLTSVTPVGADGLSTLPPVTFSYTAATSGATLSAAGAIIGAENEPAQVMDLPWVDLLDFNGDGLPDILCTDPYGGPHTVHLNQGEVLQGDGGRAVRWSAGIEVGGDARAWAANLAADHGAIAHLADMDADGLSDLVLVTATDTYYFPNAPSGSAPGWQTRKRLFLTEDGSAPPAPFGSADVKTADVDSDKRIDIIQSISVANAAQYRVWFNLDGQRYSRGVTVAPEHCFLFSDTGVHIADLNGDRVPDIARIRPTEIWVTAGLGHGQFGALVPVRMPDWTLEAAQVERAVLEDITGDGLADLVVERPAPGQLWVWVNQGNYTLAPRCTVTGLPTQFGTAPARRWADLNGNGTIDLVYADGAALPRIQAVDIGRLLGCVPTPHLLIGIDNGIGRRITIRYTTTTEAALADAAAGSPWPDPLPFPVDVVAGVTVDDTRGNLAIADFGYHEGYYDPREHQFCGFARVVQSDHGDATAPTLVSRFLFHTGKGDLAMKGNVLRTSVEQEDGGVFHGETTTWTTRLLYPGIDGRQVRFAHPTARSRDVLELGRGTPRRIGTEYEHDAYGNETAVREYGIVQPGNRGAGADERITETEYAHNPTDWLVRFPARTAVRDLAGDIATREETYYDDPTFGGANFGTVAKGLPTLLRRWVDPAHDAAFVEAVRTHYDAFGNATALLDPLAAAPRGTVEDAVGHYRTLAHDEVFHTHPVSETIHLEAGKEDLVIGATYDAGLGTVTAATDPNGHTTTYGHDVFGRLTHILRPGDDPDYPSAEYAYVLGHQVGAGRPTAPSARTAGIINYVETRFLDLEPGRAATQRGHYLISRTFVDGLGRQLMTKAEAADDPQSGAARVAVSGAVRFNAKGTAAATLNPFFSLCGGDLDAQLGFEDITAPGWQASFHLDGRQISLGLAAAHATHTIYDATGRPLRITNPDGTTEEVDYEPLGVIAADENDTDPASPHHGTPTARWSDGLGRLVRVDEIARLTDEGTPSASLHTWTTTYQYRADGLLTRLIDSQNNAKAFEYDGLGRKTLLRDPDRGTMAYFYDAASNLLQTTDAKGQTIAYAYDGANRLLTETYASGKGALPPDPRWRTAALQTSPSSGARTAASSEPVGLKDVALASRSPRAGKEGSGESMTPRQGSGDGVPSAVPESKSRAVVYHYDTPAGTIDFGNGDTGTAANTRGRLAWVEDLTGEEHTSYDERGREDWLVKSIPDALNGTYVSYTTYTSYDAMDRLVELVYPDGDRCLYEYNRRGLVERIAGGQCANLDGSPHIIAAADYAPSGQPVSTLYGNGVRTSQRYDARLRLTRLRSAPSASLYRLAVTPLVDYSYSFDHASNLLRIDDRRDGTQRPAGDPRRNTQILQYDDLYRLTHVAYSLALPGQLDRNDGHIAYRYDRIGNLLKQTSDIDHADARSGLPVCDLGDMASGGALGTWNRSGRAADAPPGPHALTEITHATLDPRPYPYDGNGNMVSIDGLACTWDVLDRLVAVEDERMRAQYAYDYSGRRIWKWVWEKDAAGNSAAFPDTTTIYVGRYFEIREYGQPTKHVFAGDTRVASITSTLDDTQPRVQRVRVSPGWNLLTLAVDLPAAAPLFQVAAAVFLWHPDSAGYLPVGSFEPLSAGAVVWLHCAGADTLVLAGTHTEPGHYPVPAGGGFVSGPALSAWPADSAFPALSRAWRFDPLTQQWEAYVPADLAFLSDFPAFIAPGEPVFIVSAAPSTLDTRPVLSILYYHQDHLGSSAVIADAEGHVVDETAYYPFGYPRHHDRPGAARSALPSRYGFTQKEQDEETGLHYFEARYLVAALGRFASVDPLTGAPLQELDGVPGAHGAYAYTGGNPLGYIDPLGLFRWPWQARPKGTREELMDEHPRTRATLAEQRSARVGSGGTIGYTALSAGCMAVTVEFKGGGGAGVHLALMKEEISGLTHEQAWTSFRSLIGPSKVTAVHVDVEPTGQWLLPGSRNDVKQKRGPITAKDPSSGTVTTMEVREDYLEGIRATKAWFGKQFRVDSGRVTLNSLDPYQSVEAQDQPSGYQRVYVPEKAMPEYRLNSQ